MMYSKIKIDLATVIVDQLKRVYGDLASAVSTVLSHTCLEFNPSGVTLFQHREKDMTLAAAGDQILRTNVAAKVSVSGSSQGGGR